MDSELRSKSKMRHSEVEICVARHFKWRQNIIVPNVSWGLGLRHEADVLVVSPKSGYGREIEIKLSTADIRADADKKVGHWEGCVRQCWFALPHDLAGAEIVPEIYGILRIVKTRGRYRYKAVVERVAKINRHANPLDADKILKLAWLGAMRVWTLKEHRDRDKRRHSKD